MVLTLHGGATGLPTPSLRRFFCIACETTAGADLILNWLFFIPGGILLGALIGVRRAALFCLVLSLGVESLQVVTPGRDPAFHDVVANTLGGWVGARLIAGRWPRWLDIALPALALATWLAPVLLLIPQARDGRVHNGWTPNRGGYELYRGEVLGSAVGGRALAPGWLDDSIEIGARIEKREPLEVVVRVGPTPVSVSPLVILARGRTEQLVLAVRGDDVLFSTHSVARRLRLKQPSTIAYGAMLGHGEGARVTLAVDPGRESRCVRVNDAESCGIAPSLTDGWAFLLGGSGVDATRRRAMGFLWVVLLGAGIGLTSSPSRGALLGAGGGIAGLLASLATPDVSPDVVSAVILAGTAAAAPYLRPWFSRARKLAKGLEPPTC